MNINRHMCTHIQIFTCNEISIDTEIQHRDHRVEDKQAGFTGEKLKMFAKWEKVRSQRHRLVR